MQQQDVARVLSDPLAQELMQSSIPARLAYVGPVTLYRFAEFFCFGHRSFPFHKESLILGRFLCHTVNHLPGAFPGANQDNNC
jgi:hypothetical protein